MEVTKQHFSNLRYYKRQKVKRQNAVDSVEMGKHTNIRYLNTIMF